MADVYEIQPNTDPSTMTPADVMADYLGGLIDEECYAEHEGYSLHISGLSQGTADRLERLLLERGCRRPCARARRHA